MNQHIHSNKSILIRCGCLALLLLLVLSVMPTASASEYVADVYYFDDGSYITVHLEESTFRAGGVKTGNKTYTYWDSNGTAEWKAVLTGTFSYTGSSATCTTCTCSVTIYDSAWYQVSKTTGKSGATATANVTMGYKFLGVTTKTVPVTITLTCDPNGNLS